MKRSKNVCAVVLAGGKATRMGGQDKGLVEIAGESIVSRICRQLEPQAGKLVINANRNLEQYRKFGFEVITDILEDYQGPLAGMLSTLQLTDKEWVLTAPCDGPFISPAYCKRMITATSENSVKLAVASDGDRLQPVYALIHQDLTDSLEKYIQSGDRKIDRWFGMHPYETVNFVDCTEMFTNINTPEQKTEIERSLLD